RARLFRCPELAAGSARMRVGASGRLPATGPRRRGGWSVARGPYGRGTSNRTLWTSLPRPFFGTPHAHVEGAAGQRWLAPRSFGKPQGSGKQQSLLFAVALFPPPSL